MHHAAICDPLSAVAAFTVGLAGSVHCLAMCGGIAGALGMRARGAASMPRSAAVAACHQLGRLSSYVLAGALAGGLGGVLGGLFDVERIALVARLLAGAVLLAIGTGILCHVRPLALVERLGGRLWQQLAPLARAIPSGGLTGAWLLGALWGWLPCGFVYSMLIFAALTGGTAQAAIMMLCFGLGTVPAVFGAGLLSARVGRLGWTRGVHAVAGWALLLFGSLTIIGPLRHVPH